jgi:hypothetical protein
LSGGSRARRHSRRTGKISGNLVDFALFASLLSEKEASKQLLADEFPLATNREFFRPNRELISRNRELREIVISALAGALFGGSSVSLAKPADDHTIISRPNRGGGGWRRVSP